MKLSPTIEADTFLSEQEVQQLAELIYARSTAKLDLGNYQDSGINGKNNGKTIATWHNTDVNTLHEVTDIIIPKLTQVFGYEPIIEDLHILESNIPYMIHNDYTSNHNLTPWSDNWLQSHQPEYTIIIPIEECDSVTVIFNEAHEVNDFEQFKQEYTGNLSIKLDKQFILNNLTHLHPKDLCYLTLKSTHSWKKGKMFAVDRRYFHCSNNFIKKGIASKKAIVIRTVRKI